MNKLKKLFCILFSLLLLAPLSLAKEEKKATPNTVTQQKKNENKANEAGASDVLTKDETKGSDADNTEPNDLGLDDLGLDQKDDADLGELDLEGLGIDEEELAGFDFDLEDLNIDDLDIDESSEKDLEGQLESSEITTTIPIPIPFIGTVELDGKIDILKGTFGVSKTTKKRVAGPLTFYPLTVSLTNKEGLSAKGDMSFFGKRSTMSLEYLRKGKEGIEALFSLTLKKAFNLPLSPWKKIPLQKVSLEYSPEKKQITSTTTLSKKDDVSFVINLEKGERHAQLKIPTFKFSDLLPFVKNTPFDGITFNDIDIKIEKPFSSDRVATLSSNIDLTGLGKNFGKKFKNIKSVTTISKVDGFNLTATMDDIDLAPVGMLKSPKLLITTAPKTGPPGGRSILVDDDDDSGVFFEDKHAPAGTGKRKLRLELSGEAVIELPLNLGKMTVDVTATLQKGRFSFFAKLKKDFTFEGITIKDPSMLLSTDGTVEFRGEGKIGEYEVWITLKHTRTGKNKKTGKGGQSLFSIEGKLKRDKPFKPFDDIPGIKDIPGVGNITINNVRVRLDSTGTIQLAGDATINKATVIVAVKGSGKGISVIGRLKKDTSISDLIPSIKGTFVEKLDAINAALVISSHQYTDRELNAKVGKGLSLVAQVSLKGDTFDGMKKMFKEKGEEVSDKLSLTATIGIPPSFSIAIPLKIELSPTVSFDNIFLDLELLPPAVSAAIQMTVKPTPKEKLDITARLKASVIEASISGTMEGTWSNPLGIKGFKLSDVAAEIGYTYGAPFPTLGITAAMKAGKFEAAFAIKVSPNLIDLILMAKLNRLFLSDIVELFNTQRKPIKADTLPKIGMKDLEIYIAPKGGSIGEIKFPPGFTVKGELNILDFWAMIELSIGMHGIVLKGGMKKVKLGPLEITGKGFDQKYGTADDGPAINLTLTKDKQEFFMSGKISIIGISAEVDILINKEAFYFLIEAKILDIFSAKIEAKSSGKGKTLDFELTVEMKNDVIDFIKKHTTTAVRQFQKNARKDIGKAEKEVKKLNNDIAKLDSDIKIRHQHIGRYKKIIAGHTQAAKAKVAAARNKVKKEEKVLDDLAHQILQRRKWRAQLQQYYDSQPWHRKPLIPTGTDITRLWFEEQGLMAGRNIALAGLTIAQEFLKGVEHMAFDPKSAKEGFEIARLGTEIAGLETAKAGVIATRDIALGILEAAKQTAVGLGEVAIGAVNVLGDILDIKRILFHGSLRELAKGKLPKLEIDLVFFGNKKYLEFQFDFKNPGKSFEAIGKMIGELFKPGNMPKPATA